MFLIKFYKHDQLVDSIDSDSDWINTIYKLGLIKPDLVIYNRICDTYKFNDIDMRIEVWNQN